MKISYFNYHHDIRGQTQGAAVQIRALARALENFGHQVDVRFLAAYEQGETGSAAVAQRNPLAPALWPCSPVAFAQCPPYSPGTAAI